MISGQVRGYRTLLCIAICSSRIYTSILGTCIAISSEYAAAAATAVATAVADSSTKLHVPSIVQLQLQIVHD